MEDENKKMPKKVKNAKGDGESWHSLTKTKYRI